MTTILDQITWDLIALGFTRSSAAFGREGDISDKPIIGMRYLTRVHESQHQYVSLIAAPYDTDTFVQAVVEVFAAPRNPRAKWIAGKGAKRRREESGLVGVHYSAARSFEEIVAAVSVMYPLTPKDV